MEKCKHCNEVHSETEEGKRLCSAIIALKGFRETCEAYAGSRIDPAVMVNMLSMGIAGTLRKDKPNEKSA